MLGRWGHCIVGLLLITAQGESRAGEAPAAVRAVLAVDQSAAAQQEVAGNGGQVLNPHSDLIFRATGATSCRDCHRTKGDRGVSPQVVENELVWSLRSKATGVHGPGRFADCLRCHAGGRKGVERY